MTTYGTTPEGFVPKPLAQTLAEIEAALITEFGPSVIQSAQSPLGQINGLMADAITQAWEIGLAAYQSRDPDQSEGVDLDILARMRVLARAPGEADDAFRAAITNVGRARVDLQDLARALRGLAGVTYVQVFVNDANATDANGLAPGEIAVSVIGGDDQAIVAEMRRFIVPGVTTYGNTYVSSEIEGFCRSFAVVRPIAVPVTLALQVRRRNDRLGCPPPATAAVRDALAADLAATLINGDDVDLFRVRQAVEARWAGQVELVSFTGERDGISQVANAPVVIGFIEIATIAADNVTVVDA